MKIKFYIILLFLTMLSLKNFATHIVGGEIFYDCLGSNNYRITLKLYRDCAPGNAQYDSPTTIFIFDSAGTFIDSLCIPFPGAIQVPNVSNIPCLAPSTSVCVEQAIFKADINLPPIAGGYNIVYQRCCRNVTILNLINPGSVGSTYMVHIPDASVTCNSSARYKHYPPIYLCVGVPINLDHSASDINGDSLYYELCDPIIGLDPSCVILGPQASGSCSQIASPPPYSFVPWVSPYSGTNPVSSSPALAINTATGLMTGTPNMIGQWVVGVCVSEYRNGILINVDKRDFQYNVVNCSMAPAVSIPVQNTFCFSDPIQFTQNSVNASSYHWDFGDPNTTLDTSNVMTPSWLYSNLGTYTASLIVNPGASCADTAYIQVTLNPSPTVSVLLNLDTICANAGAFILTGGVPNGGSFTGLGVSGGYFHPSLVSAGMHAIVYTYTDTNTCSNKDSALILVKPLPTVSVILNLNTMCTTDGALILTGGFPNGGTYSVDGVNGSYFDPGIVNAGLHQIVYTFTDSNSCSNKDSALILVKPLPTVSVILNLDTMCTTDAALALTGGFPNGGTYSVDGVIGSYFDPGIVSLGLHQIVYTFTDSNSCSNKDSARIFVELCSGISEIFNLQSSITITPNPSSGVFHIQTSMLAIGSQYKIEIYNILGENLWSTTNIKKQAIDEVDLSSLLNGIYFLHLKTDQGGAVKKIIISSK